MNKRLTASVDAQIEAMLSGHIEELFAQDGLGEEELVDPHLYLTVTRSDLLRYLRAHPDAAAAYLAHGHEPTDENIVLQKVEPGYAVWASDYGTPRFVKTFSTLEEAVAEHALTDELLG